MIRTPTRTKTQSFAGPQVDFLFPAPNSAPLAEIDSYHMSNHYLLNEVVKDRASQMSDKSTGSSNAIDSGFYSFANISDNTTSGRNPGRPKRSSEASSWTSGASVMHRQYPATLAPMVSAPILENPNSSSAWGRAATASLRRKRSPGSSSGFRSMSTAAYTIPTADNISFQITFESHSDAESSGSIRNSPLGKQGGSLIRRSSSKAKLHSATRSNITRSTSSLIRPECARFASSSLKRSQAVRCKGGLLQFFLQTGGRVKNRIRRWRLAVRKKLFTYKSRRIAKNNKKQTTSHLKRANGYVSNIKRSMSNISLKNSSIHSPIRPSPDATALIPVKAKASTAFSPYNTPPKGTRTSLRRSPSSIKRAASILTSGNSLSIIRREIAEKNLNHEGIPRTKIVRSEPSMSLSSIVRQPSIVVNNNVIPLSRMNGEANEFAIEEEDEDEYVIDTDCMKRSTGGYSDNTSDGISDVSSADEYHDSSETPKQELIENPGDEVERALDAWNHYLRSVVAQRILMRLQIRKFQDSGANPECQELIDAIISDYEENSSVHNESEFRSDSTSLTSVSESVTSGTSFECSEIYSRSGDTVASLKPFHRAINGSVKRSLTLPVGFRI